ncbi:hypothetical protein MMC29_004029 [Sticta canariensis]|nr:hypothetical protein [Sticta canariensis]
MDESVPFQGAPRSSRKGLGQDHQQLEGSASLIQSLETNLDDLRALVTCRICIRPLYEPYTIACGHTFCYSCLRQWFERDRTQKTCPDCRTKVVQQPAPAYLVRDMTQIFINRAELMTEGETTDDHRKWQQEEAEIVEKDKKAASDHSRGLFRGCFLLSSRRNAHPIRDAQDGVERCPRCTWELEDGFCVSCEYQVVYSEMSGSESPSISNFTDEEASRDRHIEEMGQFFGDGSVLPEPGSEQLDDTEGYSGLSNYSDEDAIAIATERAAIRRRFGARGPARPSLPDPIHYGATPQDYHGYSETAASEFGDTDDFSAEDDEAGSLDDFVVNDVEERPSSFRRSPRSSRYDSDEVPGIIDQFRTYSSEEEEQDHGVEDRDDQTSELLDNPPFSPIYLESDSDDGPLIRSRRHGYQRSTISPRPSSSDGSEAVASAEHYIRSRRDRRQRAHSASVRQSSITHHRTSDDARGSDRNNGFRGVAIEIDSDSGSSPPVQHHPRRRRAISRRILSDDDDNEAATASVDSPPVSTRPSSSGTATIGRASPSQSSLREHNLQPADQTFHAASPIVINSSPISHEVRQHDWPSYHEHTASPDDGSRTTRPGVGRSGNDRSGRRDSLGNRFEHRRQLHSRSPRQASSQESSAQTPQPISSRLSTHSSRGEAARYQQVTRDRAARKAERQQAKQDRRRRERDRAANASGSSRPPASPDASEIMNLDGGVQFVNRRRLGQG